MNVKHRKSTCSKIFGEPAGRACKHLMIDAGASRDYRNLTQQHGLTGVDFNHYDHLPGKREVLRRYDRQLERVLLGREDNVPDVPSRALRPGFRSAGRCDPRLQARLPVRVQRGPAGQGARVSCFRLPHWLAEQPLPRYSGRSEKGTGGWACGDLYRQEAPISGHLPSINFVSNQVRLWLSLCNRRMSAIGIEKPFWNRHYICLLHHLYSVD